MADKKFPEFIKLWNKQGDSTALRNSSGNYRYYRDAGSYFVTVCYSKGKLIASHTQEILLQKVAGFKVTRTTLKHWARCNGVDMKYYRESQMLEKKIEKLNKELDKAEERLTFVEVKVWKRR